VAPDLGFAEIAAAPAAIPPQPRDTVVLSLRREPALEKVQQLIGRLQQEGLKVVTLTQVRNDRPLNARIAEVCEIDHIDWPESTSHLQHERAIAVTYARSIAVISDRLHVLIIGGRHGAIPVLVDRDGEDKLHATLDALLNPQTLWLSQEPRSDSRLALDLTVKESKRIGRAFEAAATSLEQPLTGFINLLDA
jgi:hypothetical protein